MKGIPRCRDDEVSGDDGGESFDASVALETALPRIFLAADFQVGFFSMLDTLQGEGGLTDGALGVLSHFFGRRSRR